MQNSRLDIKITPLEEKSSNFTHLTSYHCSTRNIPQYAVRYSMQGNATTVPLHLIIYSPAMTSTALIAAGDVSLYFITEYRNAFNKCPYKHVKTVAAMLKAIHAHEDKEAAREKAGLVAAKLRTLKLEPLAKFVEESVEETLPYMNFPTEHWRKIRTNNGLERIMKEIRRRTRVVGSFPAGFPAIMLVGAGLRHIATTKWGTRQYLVCKTCETDVL